MQLAAAQVRPAKAIRHGQAQGAIKVALSPEALAIQCLAGIEDTAFLCAVTGDSDIAAKVRATIHDLTLLLHKAG